MEKPLSLFKVDGENAASRQVGQAVAKIRQEMKMTQAELAAEMSAHLGREVRPLTVTRLEGGKRPIGVDELVALATALRVPPADLLDPQDLPMGVVRLNSATREAVRASNALKDALRQWYSARKFLGMTLQIRAVQDAPASYLHFANQLNAMNVDQLDQEIRTEMGE